MKFYFDVDDTLYDQYIPFKRAYDKVFNEIKEVPLKELYKKFRFHSDEVFEQSEKGEISMRNMHIYRIVTAFVDFGIIIGEYAAIKFQEIYQEYQRDIMMSGTMRHILDLLVSNDIEIGIITNGPFEHQRNKLDTLNAYDWFKCENIYISSSVGIAKPNVGIFKMAGLGTDCFFVGDSYFNDVLGAKNASCKCIWLNRKNEIAQEVRPDYEAADEMELMAIIKSILSQRD